MAQDPPRQHPPRHDAIRYDLLVQDALRKVVKGVLADTAKNGLPGEHHFFVTFDTRLPGVKLSPRMLKKYPESMNVVLQHVFWDLTVNDEFFEVGLSFGGVGEKLTVPFSAVTAFFDPSVEFGLKFEARDEPAPAGGEAGETPKPAPSSGERAPRRPLAAVAAKPLALAPAAAERDQTVSSIRPAADGKEAAGVKDKPKLAAKDAEAGKVVSIDSFRKKP